MDLVRRLSQSGVSPALLGLPAQPAAVNQNDEAAVDAEIERLCECLQQGNMGPFAVRAAPPSLRQMWHCAPHAPAGSSESLSGI